MYGRTPTDSTAHDLSSTANNDGEEPAFSSDSEEEDDEGILASTALDAQIQETLEAIRKKDPRVYDKNVTFYPVLDDENGAQTDVKPKEPPPMYLSDYHRKTLLEEVVNGEPEEVAPSTYVEQQDDLKTSIVREMHVAAKSQSNGEVSGSDNEDAFLVAKPLLERDADAKTRPKYKIEELDIEKADKDPETYLSNFISARAWVPTEGAKFQPFESDDDEEERRADEFEEAYNLRFEDPVKSNERLVSHARDAAAKYSVRKEMLNPRKREREAERAKKKAAKQLREEEKARLRKLKLAEAEEKVQKIKEAAGILWNSLDKKDWMVFLEEGWDDARWDEEMKRRFGDDYYAARDATCEKEGAAKKQKLRKPKWSHDIEINDLVPDSEADDFKASQFELSGNANTEGGVLLESNIARPMNDRTRGRDEEKKEARRERRNIERLVDEQMHVDETLSKSGYKHARHFRYRGTSPLSFGLTAEDILMASDSQLNQYAGLKKIATFRDSEKKRKDKRQLGKKARLRQWRKDTFGDEHGPQQNLAGMLAGQENDGRPLPPKGRGDVVNIKEGKSRKRRAKMGKSKI